MTQVTFLAPGQNNGMSTVEVQIASTDAYTLIELMEQCGMPIECTCCIGACGRCAVKVALVNKKGGRLKISLSEKEKRILLAHGKLTRRQSELPFLTYRGPVWRLACQFQVGENDIIVAL